MIKTENSRKEPRLAKINHGIAIIGIGGRFPVFGDVDSFWAALLDHQVFSRRITSLSLRGTPHEAYASDPAYVFRTAAMDHPGQFDAAAFGLSAAEALMADPQQRWLMTCTREALERSGHPKPESEGIRTAVFCGTSFSSYLLFNLLRSSDFVNRDPLQLSIACDKDFTPSRIAYALDLHGPAVCVQSACSTSLTAVHLACQSILSGESDMALAGGASISAWGPVGYLYDPQGIRSPDGFCRSYDAHAAGTIFGDGVAVVVLRRLEDAITAGDDILAVIRGSAVNNDGHNRLGYTAPGIQGQSAVIAEAFDIAGLDPREASFIEGHGTATALGDVIEVQALTNAYAAFGPFEKCSCLLGSVKSNVGHLDCASGITGLLKAVLSLKHRVYPGTKNFVSPNPALKVSQTPFCITSENVPLLRQGELTAGVSSFGIGGTNAHVVLSSVPTTTVADVSAHPTPYLFSARNKVSLRHFIEQTRKWRDKNENISTEQIAFTLANKRSVEKVRAMLFDEDLTKNAAESITVREITSQAPYLTLLFPGQGTNLAGSLSTLVRADKQINDQVRELCDLFGHQMPQYGKNGQMIYDYLTQTLSVSSCRPDIPVLLAQPASFIVSLSLLKAFETCQINPDFVCGHSLGEITAAYCAGILSLNDTVQMIASRSRLSADTPKGVMLAANMSLQHATSLLFNTGLKIDIAAQNAPEQVVFSGAPVPIEDLCNILDSHSIRWVRLPSQKAFHSHLFDCIQNQWNQALKPIRYHSARIHFQSCVDGAFLSPGNYWSLEKGRSHWKHHLRQTVYFQDAINGLWTYSKSKQRSMVFLEMGYGGILSNLVRYIAMQDPELNRSCSAVNIGTGNSPLNSKDLLQAWGQLWCQGFPVHFLAGQNASNICLPSAPLVGDDYWVNPDKPVISTAGHGFNTLISKNVVTNTNITKTDRDKEKLLNIWKKFLQIPDISGNDNFFSLGGNSMTAIEVCRAAREVGIAITPKHIFSAPTVSKLVSLLELENRGKKSIVNNEGCNSIKQEEISAVLEQLEF